MPYRSTNAYTKAKLIYYGLFSISVQQSLAKVVVHFNTCPRWHAAELKPKLCASTASSVSIFINVDVTQKLIIGDLI